MYVMANEGLSFPIALFDFVKASQCNLISITCLYACTSRCKEFRSFILGLLSAKSSVVYASIIVDATMLSALTR